MLVLAEVIHFGHLALHLKYQQSSVREKKTQIFLLRDFRCYSQQQAPNMESKSVEYTFCEDSARKKDPI